MKKINCPRCRYDIYLYGIIISVGLNIIGGVIVEYFKLPAFLDSVGTILIGAVLGPLYGALVGLITNLLLGYFVYSGLYYFAVVNILIGVTAGLIFKKYPFNFKYILIAALAVAIVGTIFGNLISYYVFGGITGSSIDQITMYLLKTGMDRLLAVNIAGFILNLIDKVASFAIVFVIVGTFQNIFEKSYFQIHFENVNEPEETDDEE